MPMPALRSRPRLLHIFRPSCLCLTVSSIGRPAIRFQGADSTDPDCRLSNVLCLLSLNSSLPCSVASCVSESALTKFYELESRFDSGYVPGDPWTHVDSFGQVKFYKALLTAYKSQKSSKIVRSSSSVVIAESGTAFRSPGKTVKSCHKGVIPASEVTKAVK